MSWWGVIIGGAVGYLLGGPLGALLGASCFFGVETSESEFFRRDDSGKQSGFRGSRPPRAQPGDQLRVQAAFFTATFAVMGYIAKSDKRVTRKEILLAEQVMREMRLDAARLKAARALFNQGKQAGFDIDGVLKQFCRECHRRRNLIQMFIEIQVHTALADGTLDPNESFVLRQVAAAVGVSASELERIIDFVRNADAAHSHGGEPALEEAYHILGVDAKTPLDEVKKSYRRLMAQHHPDKLVSKGLPEEMMKLANEKTHEIRMAWERVKRERQER